MLVISDSDNLHLCCFVLLIILKNLLFYGSFVSIILALSVEIG